MRFFGNIIWFVFGGAVIAMLWLVGAAVFAISVIGLPIARGAIEMAKMSAFPFGKDVVHVREIDQKGVNAVTATTGVVGFIANAIWALTFGWLLFAGYVIAGIFNCLTLIGIPFGIQAFKLAGISLWPVGRRVVTLEFAEAVRRSNAETRLSKMRGTELVRP